MATSDVEMRLDERSGEHHSPITVESPSPASSTAPSTAPAETHVLQARKKVPPSSRPPSSTPAAALSGANLPITAPTTSKPNSTKPASSAPRGRSPSPSPPPPPPAPPLQTIRLEITLGGPQNYEVNIAQLSKETGQRPATPPRVLIGPARDESDDSEGDDEREGDKTKKKRRRKNDDYYDTADPFIDDSELAIDERTYFAQTKQQGFYVSAGQVALLTDKAPARKPKSKAAKKMTILPPSESVNAALSSGSLPPFLAPLSTASSKLNTASKVVGPIAGPSQIKSELSNGAGSRSSPIPLDSEDDKAGVSVTTPSLSGVKRPYADSISMFSNGISTQGVSEAKKRRKAVEIQPFHPELQAEIDKLTAAIEKQDWSNKGKFPPNIKPQLAQVALKAIVVGEYDDNFFNLMPRIFPYNRFTMQKLIKRTIWKEHIALLQDRQNQLIEDLRVLAAAGFPKAKEEWERSVQQWEKRQAFTKAEEAAAQGHGSAEGTPNPSSAQPTPQLESTALPTSAALQQRASHDGGDDMDVDDPQGSAAGGKRDAHPPPKRFRLTDQMKQIIWQLVCLSNECCRIENEKNQLENNNTIISDQGVRKTLYQKIVAVFPDGWLSSGQISRDVSVMKKKYEKEVMENEGIEA